jgi:hypothetical protein
MDVAAKNPERVRLGRLGALTVHARGRTNTRPARAAWEAGLAAEFGITDEIDAAERKRRLDAALRVRMQRLAMARWAKKSATTREVRRGAPQEVTGASSQSPQAA